MIRPVLKLIRSTTSQTRCLSKKASATKKLFTPGPLGVSMETKEAMLRDVGSRDVDFIGVIKEIRTKLVSLAGVTEDEFTCVPMQGSGTFAIEAVLSTAVPRSGGKVLILENGAYGRRQAKICQVAGIPYKLASFPEHTQISGNHVKSFLEAEAGYVMITLVHCETSSGIFNQVEEVGSMVKKHAPDAVYFVDAMSSFGAVPINMADSQIDYLVSSANKCIEGVPGFGYAICNKQRLLACSGNARSYCLDLVDQCEQLDKGGQFRFTPPTHAMLAFKQALLELNAEGGVNGRSERYQKNCSILRKGMRDMGFEEFLSDKVSGYIITSYQFPSHPNFDFTGFYQRLSDKGMVIYPGKLLDADCFRIGNIGALFPEDIGALLTAIRDVCHDMKLPLPLK